MKKDITELFVYVDDFCSNYETFLASNALPSSNRRPTRRPCLNISEIMTIVLLFQRSPAKNFKYFYGSFLQDYRSEFPILPSYNRFIELEQRSLKHFTALLMMICAMATKTGIGYIDSTPIPVCHNKRIYKHKVFDGLAERGKSTMGWFFGFKLHLIINQNGELLAAQLTPGNVDDRVPVRDMAKKLTGLLFGDKGYIDKNLFADLYEKGLKLVTGIKSTMKNKLMAVEEKLLLRKRSVIESVNGLLKETMQISHTRHRSISNALIHIISSLIAYSLRDRKPKINWPR
jgi:hypothetical protein